MKKIFLCTIVAFSVSLTLAQSNSIKDLSSEELFKKINYNLTNSTRKDSHELMLLLEESIRREPKNEGCLVALGSLCLERINLCFSNNNIKTAFGLKEKAALNLKVALEVNPNSYNTNYTLASSYFNYALLLLRQEKGNFKDEIKENYINAYLFFKKCQQIDSNNESARYCNSAINVIEEKVNKEILQGSMASFSMKDVATKVIVSNENDEHLVFLMINKSLDRIIKIHILESESTVKINEIYNGTRRIENLVLTKVGNVFTASRRIDLPNYPEDWKFELSKQSELIYVLKIIYPDSEYSLIPLLKESISSQNKNGVDLKFESSSSSLFSSTSLDLKNASIKYLEHMNVNSEDASYAEFKKNIKPKDAWLNVSGYEDPLYTTYRFSNGSTGFQKVTFEVSGLLPINKNSRKSDARDRLKEIYNTEFDDYQGPVVVGNYAFSYFNIVYSIFLKPNERYVDEIRASQYAPISIKLISVETINEKIYNSISNINLLSKKNPFTVTPDIFHELMNNNLQNILFKHSSPKLASIDFEKIRMNLKINMITKESDFDPVFSNEFSYKVENNTKFKIRISSSYDINVSKSKEVDLLPSEAFVFTFSGVKGKSFNEFKQNIFLRVIGIMDFSLNDIYLGY